MTKAREAIRIVERDGWFFVRQRGSHRQFHHPVKKGTVTIPGPLSKQLSEGIWQNIQKQAGLKGKQR